MINKNFYLIYIVYGVKKKIIIYKFNICIRIEVLVCF